MKAFLAVMGGAVGLLLATTYAAAQDTKSCEAGDAKACIAAGNALIAKDNPNPDMPRGKQLFERACNLGNPSGCTLAGQLYLASGLGLVRDTPKGLALLNKGCSGGEGYACHLLGSAYDAGSAGLAVDKEKAISYFSSACTLGKENSCNVVHNIFLDEAPAGRARPHELAVVLG
ncbi:MAG: sel1 repeat family protein, partial [Betaproteobacteria bacterium]|nr:sel1 repeat family protein [Betaproteobacteria bacterium]